MKAAKAIKGPGGKLDKDEMASVRSEFRTAWNAMDDDELALNRQVYQDWRDTPAPLSTCPAEGEPASYTTVWGGGCTSTPITTEETAEYHALFGWPKECESELLHRWGSCNLVEIDRAYFKKNNAM